MLEIIYDVLLLMSYCLVLLPMFVYDRTFQMFHAFLVHCLEALDNSLVTRGNLVLSFIHIIQRLNKSIWPWVN